MSREKEALAAILAEHRQAVDGFFAQELETLAALAHRIAGVFARGGRLLLCGNGGSACDAMHLAGEFVGRFARERAALPAIALSADTGMLTAIGNDYGFDRVFARQVEAYGAMGDVLIALSTSGASPNVLHALEAARVRGLFTVLMTGAKGASRTQAADMLLAVPASDTARVQEAHMLALHALAALTEEMVTS